MAIGTNPAVEDAYDGMTLESAIFLVLDIRAQPLWVVRGIDLIAEDRYEVVIFPVGRPREIKFCTTQADWERYRDEDSAAYRATVPHPNRGRVVLSAIARLEAAGKRHTSSK